MAESGPARILVIDDDETLQAAVEQSGAHGYIRKGDRDRLGEQIAKVLSS